MNSAVSYPMVSLEKIGIAEASTAFDDVRLHSKKSSKPQHNLQTQELRSAGIRGSKRAGTASSPVTKLAYNESRPKQKKTSKRSKRRSNGIDDVDVKVDLSQQKMRVYLDGKHVDTWSISSGKRNFETPTGHYKPQSLRKNHRSSKYNNAPMPYSIFFRGGYAIHAGSGLGRPRSHGCIRLARGNAQKLYNWVSEAGRHNTDIVIKH